MVETADFHENFSRLLVAKPPTGGVTQRRNPYIIKEEETMKKRILSVLLALVMALSLCTVALAEPTEDAEGSSSTTVIETNLDGYYYGGAASAITVQMVGTGATGVSHSGEKIVYNYAVAEGSATCNDETSWLGNTNRTTGYYLAVTYSLAGNNERVEGLPQDASSYKLYVYQCNSDGSHPTSDPYMTNASVENPITAANAIYTAEGGSSVTVYFPLPDLTVDTYEVTIPFTKKVTQNDNTTPPAAAFTLEQVTTGFNINFNEGQSNNNQTPSTASPVSITFNSISTNGVNTYNTGLITVSGPRTAVEAALNTGFYVREKNDAAPDWTYDTQVWEVKKVAQSDVPEILNNDSSGNDKVIAVRKVTLTDNGYHEMDGAVWQLPANLIFTNTYTKHTTPAPSRPHYTHTPTPTEKIEAPKTFDAGIAVYGVSALLSLTGSAWVVTRRRDR